MAEKPADFQKGPELPRRRCYGAYLKPTYSGAVRPV